MRGACVRAAAAALAVALALPAPGRAAPGPLDDPEVRRYVVVDQPVDDVLREFAASLGIAIDLGEGIEGRITNFAGRYTARGFLDAVTADFGLAWYHDGAALHVTGADETKSVVIDFDRVSADALTVALDELGVADERFALRETKAAGIGVVTGPPRYVELVENAFLMLVSRGEAAPPLDPPAGATHAMTVVRGEAVSVWRGAAAQEAEAKAASGEAWGVVAPPASGDAATAGLVPTPAPAEAGETAPGW